jgi:hypothetical protein
MKVLSIIQIFLSCTLLVSFIDATNNNASLSQIRQLKGKGGKSAKGGKGGKSAKGGKGGKSAKGGKGKGSKNQIPFCDELSVAPTNIPSSAPTDTSSTSKSKGKGGNKAKGGKGKKQCEERVPTISPKPSQKPSNPPSQKPSTSNPPSQTPTSRPTKQILPSSGRTADMSQANMFHKDSSVSFKLEYNVVSTQVEVLFVINQFSF